jgi:hypothetical protein
MTQSQYIQAQRTKSIVILRNARGLGHPALVAWESLPNKYQAAALRVLGVDRASETIERSNMLEQYIEHSARIAEQFDGYVLPDGRHLPADTRRQYYADAIVLEGLKRLIAERTQMRATRGARTTIDWSEMAGMVRELDTTALPHKLPDNAKRLKDKYARYLKEGLISLVHRGFLNRNASKVALPVHESVLKSIIGNGLNWDDARVERTYNVLAQQNGWQAIKRVTVSNWRKKLDLDIYASKHGTKAFDNVVGMQVKRSAPTMPLQYWVMDGWTVELMYQEKDEKRGVTTYHQRPTVVVILDACCKYPIGYAIGRNESPALILTALRNAAKHTEELFGRMYRTAQLQCDNYAIKTMTPVYEVMGDKVTPAAVGNAKAKIIEPYFRELNDKYCRTQRNSSGYGITARKEAQPNVEYLNKYKHEFPDFRGVCRQVEAIIARERADKLALYMEAWKMTPDERKIGLSHQAYLKAFGERTGFTNRLEGSGVNITIHGQKMHYDCFDIAFRRHRGEDWTVCYDPDDLHTALAVNADETLQFDLEEKYVQPMALADRQPGDAEQLQRVRSYNKELKGYVIDKWAETADTIKEANLDLPQLSETLGKLLITDSRGQHKDERSHDRMLAAARKVDAKQSGKAAKRPAKTPLKQRSNAEKTEEETFREQRQKWLEDKVDMSEYISMTIED